MSDLISASDITQQSGALPFRKISIYSNHSFHFIFFLSNPTCREVDLLRFKCLTIIFVCLFFIGIIVTKIRDKKIIVLNSCQLKPNVTGMVVKNV